MVDTHRYGLLGKSLNHSHSPALFAQRFKREGLDSASYSLFELDDISQFHTWLYEIENRLGTLNGLNVTVPYKESIVPLLKGLSREALAIGAVNAIKPMRGQGWIGHNTDAQGFLNSIRPFLRSDHERALIIGNGGAARAVRHGLKELGIQVIHVTRKDVAWPSVRYADLSPEAVHHYKLIVHCTPVGTYPNVHESVPFPWTGVTPQHLVVDLIYNPVETQFLQEARLRGAETMNGRDMLHAQAEAAWRWWNA
mgnify:CR=1 FL=1|tara:strand:- start:1555 stop:2313 length:759 start_codon:yes stop_codon:yes gene_type:complete